MAPCNSQTPLMPHCICSCKSVVNSTESANESENTSQEEPYNILMHIVPPRENLICRYKSETKGKLSTETAYREAFCRRKKNPKHKPVKTEICPPKDFIIPSDGIMTRDTTHKLCYKPSSKKTRIACKGQLVVKPCTVTVPEEKFEGKSEAREAFQDPFNRQPSLKIVRLIERKIRVGPSYIASTSLTGDGQPKIRRVHKLIPWSVPPISDSKSTTYNSTFKALKPPEKVKTFVPRTNVISSSMPFRHTSQYTDDFQRKRLKELEKPKWHPRNKVYSAPKIPMEHHTSYKLDFSTRTFSIQQKLWEPTHSKALAPIKKNSNISSNGETTKICTCFCYFSAPQSDDNISKTLKCTIDDSKLRCCTGVGGNGNDKKLSNGKSRSKVQEGLEKNVSNESKCKSGGSDCFGQNHENGSVYSRNADGAESRRTVSAEADHLSEDLCTLDSSLGFCAQRVNDEREQEQC